MSPSAGPHAEVPLWISKLSGTRSVIIAGYTLSEYHQMLQDQFIRRAIDVTTAAEYWSRGICPVEAANAIADGCGIV